MLNGLPAKVDPQLSIRRRILRSQWTWLCVAGLVGYAVLAVLIYREISHNVILEVQAVTKQMGSPVQISLAQVNEALGICVRYALPTLAVYFLIFLLVDRLRPTTWLMKVMSLGWGAAVAVFVSLYTNSWVAERINVTGPVDPTTSAAAAIFVAPFVEEASKATILFMLAILVRYRIATVLQSVTLAGLSAIGFAFTENITYYLRGYIYAGNISGQAPMDVLRQMAFTRGVLTSFGHPLFTSLTAIGMAVALTNRSKLVRIVSPLAGFCFAALGHMMFNSMATASNSTIPVVAMGGAMVLAVAFFLFRRSQRETAQIRYRLADFVREGWLRPRDPVVFGSEPRRAKLALAALLRGRRVFSATLSLQRAMSELAYLRAAQTRGVIDEAGLGRGQELLARIGELRGVALDETNGLRIRPETWHLPKIVLPRRSSTPVSPQPPQGAWPAPAPVGAGTSSGSGWAGTASAIDQRPWGGR
jgi:RsiW-degrading membrane proteinase PrsW (M82 family)